MGKIRTIAWAMVTLLFAIGCSQKEEYRTVSTTEMALELDSLRAEAFKGTTFPYFTHNLLKKMELGVQGMPYTMKFSSWLDYVLVLLLKGENEKCIEIIDAFLKQNRFDTINKESLFFYKVKALAYLRKGEITNCIDNHSGQSCIMPIKGDGIHTVMEPVQNAIVIYEQLLAYDSMDYQSRWFLNLCHMAVDQYPSNVAPEYVIPVSAFASDTTFKAFPNMAMHLGVAVNNHAGGASLEDFNNDGLLDVFTTSYSLAEPSKLFINNGRGFDDVTESYGLNGMVGGLNNIHADFNNDGRTDIYIMRGAWLDENGAIPNSLLINEGGTFSDATKASGLYSKMPTGAVSVADFNQDGYLDLFVGNESSRVKRYPSQLYVNNQDGTFTEVSAQVGMELTAYVKAANWGDVNNDGLPDLFVSVYAGRNRLYLNEGGEDISSWKFKDISIQAGITAPSMSFTGWFWDYNQDGWQDIMVFGYDNSASYAIAGEVGKAYLGLEFKGELPRLYTNNQDNTFSDVAQEVGLQDLLYVMGGNYGDLNNDGFPDMYLGTGEFNIWASVPNKAYLNVRGEKMMDVTTAGEFGQIQKGHGVAFGDFDNDGDQDIYHQVGGAAESDVFHNMLFKNPGFDNNWISIDLEGVEANRSAIGAHIEVELEEEGANRVVHHWVNTGGSFGANALRAEIGLGQASKIESIKVTWPSKEKRIEILQTVEMNKMYHLKQGEGKLTAL